jgi:hypothetical protein
MLRFLFIVLLLANAAVFAYHQGQLDELMPNGREPARLQRQLNADQIRLVDPKDLQTASAPALASCVEVGNFTATQARRLAPQLAALVSGQELVRHEREEASSHMVLIPPQGGRNAAEQRAAQLRERGITDFYILQESSPHRWGISLGVFKNEEGALAHLANVTQQGVTNAQIVEHSMALPQIAFQLRGEPQALNAAVDKWLQGFPRYEKRACE